VLFLAQKWRAS